MRGPGSWHGFSDKVVMLNRAKRNRNGETSKISSPFEFPGWVERYYSMRLSKVPLGRCW